MTLKLLFLIFLCVYQVGHAVVFQGIVETGVQKNTFLCSGDATDAIGCTNADAGAIGFNVSGGKMLQLFNNQAAWYLLQATHQQYLTQDQRYSASDLQQKMIEDGWVAMGGYCLIITTNPILTDIVMPSVTPTATQTKVVVQLWYNGEQELQLWSQDAKALKKGQSFQVEVSTDADTLSTVTGTDAVDSTFNNGVWSQKVIATSTATGSTTSTSSSTVSVNTPAQSSSTSLRLNFLSALGLQYPASNRNSDIYNQATQSPRMVKIKAS